MAIIEKRTLNDSSVSYRAKVRLKGKPAVSATFERLTDAKIWIQQTETEIRQGKYFKTSDAQKRTLKELIEKYEKEVLKHKQGIENQNHYLKFWKDELGAYSLST